MKISKEVKDEIKQTIKNFNIALKEGDNDMLRSAVEDAKSQLPDAKEMIKGKMSGGSKYLSDLKSFIKKADKKLDQKNESKIKYQDNSIPKKIDKQLEHLTEKLFSYQQKLGDRKHPPKYDTIQKIQKSIEKIEMKADELINKNPKSDVIKKEAKELKDTANNVKKHIEPAQRRRKSRNKEKYLERGGDNMFRMKP